MITIRIPDPLASNISGNLAAIAGELEAQMPAPPSARYHHGRAESLDVASRRKALEEMLGTIRALRAQIDAGRSAREGKAA